MNDSSAESNTSCGCELSCGCAGDGGATRELDIVWQRLLTDGTTCPRCQTTQQAVHHAVDALSDVLRPLGIRPTLEERVLDQVTFEGSPDESNRIWIAGRPLEAWLDATVGASPCCSVCGAADCRTLVVDGSTFEAVPERLIIKAGLAAAASLLTV